MSGSRLAAWFGVLVAIGACHFDAPATSTDGGDDAGSGVTVSFEATSSGADEMSGTVMIPVVLSAPSDATVTVAYARTEGTATPGVDFTISSSMLTFAPGETQAQIPIVIIHDADEAEQNETLLLTLSSPSGASLAAPTTHMITISNELLPRVEFSVVTSSTNEPSQTMALVTLDKAATTLTTVQLGVSGTASPGLDFTVANNQTVTFAAGELVQLVSIGEVDDALDEDDETVILQLKNPSPEILVGGKSTLTHTILDEDPTPTLSFVPATLSQSEATAAAVATVVLSAPSGRTVTVDYAQSAGAATASDLTIGGAGSLTFLPGETTHDIPLTITQDLIDELDETAVIQLANPVNATLPGPDFTLTIVDDDTAPTASFTAAASTVTEGAAATVTLTVALSAASGLTVTVPFATAAGTTAVAPADFTLMTPSPLTFAPGTLTQTITITIANDAIGEVDELVNVALGNPTNATLGPTPAHQLTIVDDDCLGTGKFRVCPTTAPAGTTSVSGTLNTNTDPKCAAVQPAGWIAAGQPAACFVIAANINVNGGGVTVTGTRPLVLFATGTVSVSAALNASGQGAVNGPGGASSLCKSFPGGAPQSSNGGGGGGAGASFMSKGGDGADGNGAGGANGGNAPAVDATDPTILRGGCRGQDGGDGNGNGTSGSGGGGGGAVYLVAGTITISGSIDVSGGGGVGGAADAGGGGGAGAGGMILLDAVTLSANGTLMSNGGGGGQGADTNTNGGPGADPSIGTPTSAALGGTGTNAGGPGGNGFAGATAATAGTVGTAGKGGGAGGGGGGFIKGSGALGGTVSAGKIVP